jgi:hypothetical protein
LAVEGEAVVTAFFTTFMARCFLLFCHIRFGVVVDIDRWSF